MEQEDFPRDGPEDPDQASLSDDEGSREEGGGPDGSYSGRSSTDGGGGGGGDSGDRSRERLAWRCVEAARAAASFVPRLTAHVLLPAAALRLPHSRAPAVRVPAGDRRSYSAAGAAGGPLTVAAVALRDLSAGAPLSCSWVDAELPFAARMAGLKEYERVICPASPISPSSPTSPSGASEPSLGGERPGGCGCPKCAVDTVDLSAPKDEDGGRSVERRLLEAARQAVDEDR